MTNNEGPWGGSEEGDNPWTDPIVKPKKAKITDFVKAAENNTILGGGNNIKYRWIILAAIVLWLLSGFYQLDPNEQGVVLRFGKYIETTEAGLRYKLPFPIDTVTKVNTTQERSIEIGKAAAYDGSNNTVQRTYRTGRVDEVESFTESHMLTGDENIVDINLTVVWKVKDAKNYLFSMRSPDQTVRVAAQSVLREIIGQSQMQSIITGDRGKVEDDTKEELQKLLNDFNSGIEIVRVKLQKADPPKQVIDAFNEVQRAKSDRERFKNEAEAYRNEVLPKARGEAAKRLQGAEAYRTAVINEATGAAERFLSVYNAYKQGKEVTSKRLYIETIENVLYHSNKVVIDPSTKGGNIIPVLPLNNIKN